MAKKSEINKKGRLAKSTLSVVLAASMVLTSSSFVWAAPEDVVIVEEGATVIDADEAAELNTETPEEAGAAAATEVQTADDSENTGVAATWTADVDYPANDPVSGEEGYPFTGRAISPTLEFYNENNQKVDNLVKNVDYTVELANNINAGTATAVITFRNNHDVAAIETTFKIRKVNIAGATVVYKDNDGFTYNGTVQRPEIASATMHLGADTDPDYSLTEGEDFTVEAADIAGGGTYDLVNHGIQKIKLKATDGGNFYGETAALTEYNIGKAEFDSTTIKVVSREVEYVEGAWPVPADVTVTDAVTGDELVQDDGNPANGTEDYQIWYEGARGEFSPLNDPATDIDSAHRIKIVYVNPDGNFKPSNEAFNTPTSSITTTYSIVKNMSLASYAEEAELYSDAARITVIPNNTYTYNATAQGVRGIDVPGLDYSGDESKTDFTVEFPVWEDCVNVGTYDVKLTGKNKFAGQTATVKLNIIPMPLNTSNVSSGVDADGNVNVAPTNLNADISMRATLGTTHNNYEAANATVVIRHDTPNGEVVLKQGTDYTYTTDKTNGKVTITGIGNYSTVTTKGKTFTTKYAKIKTLELNDASISATVNGTYPYTGTDVKPDPKDIVLIENGYQLASGIDFTVKNYYDNIKVGTAKIVLEGVANRGYSGTRTVTFQIGGTAVSETYMFKAIDDITYDGNPHRAAFNNQRLPLVMVNKTTGSAAPDNVVNSVSLKYYRGDKETIDFVTPGTITVIGTVRSGSTTFEGTISTSYKIVGKPINSVAKVEAIADQEYTGEALTPEVKVVFIDGGKALVKDTDYTVTYSSNIDLGTATVIVKGIGYYSGELVATFKIVGQMPQNFEFLAAQARDIRNRTLASKATTVKYNKGQEPKTEVAYSSSDEKVFTVDAKTGAIKYTGVGTATLTAVAAESDTYKAETKTMTVRVTPRTPASVKVTSTSAKKITVKAAKVNEAAYYQIKIWKEGRKPVYVNVKNAGDLSKVYTTKSAGTFNVQVRTFMYPGSKVADNYLSKFSSTHTVIVK